MLQDSLVPDTDKNSETIRNTFLQRAVQKNHDLRQIHVLHSVWKSKTDSMGKFILKSTMACFGMQPINMTLNNAAGQKKTRAFISQQVDSFDESGTDPLEDTLLDQDKDVFPPYSIIQSSFNSHGESFLRLQRSLLLSMTKRIRWLTPNHTPMVATLSLNLLWVNPIRSHSKSTFMRMTILLMTLILKILLKQWFMSVSTDDGIDPPDFDIVISAFKAKSGNTLKILQGK